MIRRCVRILYVLMISFAQSSASAPSVEDRPNIIFVLVDDLGFGDVGVFFQNLRAMEQEGRLPYHITPTLDEMARGGAMFTNQYCNAPVCAPSRASLLTGLHQGNAFIRNNQFDKALEDNHTIATMLQAAGYATAAIGKWGLQGVEEVGPDWPAHPLNRGFDYFLGYMRHADGHEHYPSEGIYRGKKEVWENKSEISAALDKCYTADLWTAAAKRWITSHANGGAQKPFFMYLAYDTPHAVLELPTQAYPDGGGISGGLQWMGTPGRMINTASGVPDSYIHPGYASAKYDHDQNPATPAISWPDTYKRYATSVRRIDYGLADLIQLLRDLEIMENTLIVFSSDNGPSIESYLPDEYVNNEPTFFGSFGPFDGIKRDTWEGGLRMPVIAYWPGVIDSTTIVSTPSMLSDWMATFADIADVPIPARTDGHSLFPALLGKPEGQLGSVYVEYFGGNGRTPDFAHFEPSRRNRKRGEMQMIRLNDFVGVRYDIGSNDDDFEIYNIEDDPKQRYNLAGSAPKYDSLQKAMKITSIRTHRVDSGSLRPYDGTLIPALTLSPVGLKPGIAYSFFPGAFPYVSREPSLSASQRGSALTMDMLKTSTQGQWVLEGLLKIPESGIYQIKFSTNGKAIVRLHNILAIDADYNYFGNEERNYEIHLEKGLHPIKAYVLNEESDPLRVQLFLKTPDGERLSPELVHRTLE